MFSGGIDSTGMLYTLLTDKKYFDYDIHAHFIYMINRQNRYIAEAKAVELSLAWFKTNCRKFEFTKNAMDFYFLTNRFSFDTDVINFVCSQIIVTSDYEYDYVSIGQTKTDFSQPSFNDQIVHFQLSQKLLDTMLLRFNKSIKKMYPLINMSKKQIWDMLPEELKKSTWSCRTPILKDNVYIACDKCKTCIEIKKQGIIL